MKIIDGLKLKGTKVEIPDCNRDDFPEFFQDMGYKVGVEIGVWKGEFGKTLAKSGLKLYGVDPYLYYEDSVMYGKQSVIEDAYKTAEKVLAPYEYTIIRKTSMEAVKDFDDESLDFVYIDGNHSFKYVAEDICEWSKKVRKGGTISGHDYMFFKNSRPGYCDVKYVIEAYTAARKIPKWYVLGRRHPRPGEKRDKFRSWFWFKL